MFSWWWWLLLFLLIPCGLLLQRERRHVELRGYRQSARRIMTSPRCPPHSQVVYYRTRDGRADYGFSIERKANGGYRIYIVSQPPYGGRDTSASVIHRLRDGSRYYICWTGRLDTEAQARQVAAMWADRTQRYIWSGRF